MTTNNPLLSNDDLPDFAAVRPEHVTPAIDELLTVPLPLQKYVTLPRSAAAAVGAVTRAVRPMPSRPRPPAPTRLSESRLTRELRSWATSVRSSAWVAA